MSRLRSDRLLLALAGAALLLMATAGSALGKCPQGENGEEKCPEGVYAMVDFGDTLRAGTAATLRVYVMENGQPFNADRVELVFNRIADATVITVPAELIGTDSGWEARVELPAGGSWNIVANVYDSAGTRYSNPIEVMQVIPLPAGAPNAPTTPTTPTSPATPAPITLPWVWIPLLAGALLAVGALSIRRLRNRTATA